MEKKKRNPERIAFSLVMTGHRQNGIRASFCRLPRSFRSLHEPEDTSMGPFCFCACPSLPSTDPRVCPVHCEVNVSVLHSACHLRHVLLCSRATALGNSKTQANSCFQIRNRSILWAEIPKTSLICEAVLKIVNDSFEYTHGCPERLFLLLLFSQHLSIFFNCLFSFAS